MQEANGLYLAGLLADRGLAVRWHALVRDEIDDVVEALRTAASTRRARVCVVSGGLGPTDDDRTAEAAARLLGVRVTRRQEWIDHLEQRYAALGRRMLDNNRGQADLPDGAQLIWNDQGTAPAFSIEFDGCTMFFLPGVPREYRPLCRDVVLPHIAQAAGISGGDVTSRTLRTFGLPESEADRRLAGVVEQTGAWLGYRASFPEVHIRLRGTHDQVEAAADEVRQRLAPAVYGEGDQTFPSAVADALRGADATLAVAESCTGGLAGKLITDSAGASDVFVGGALVYSNALKQSFTDVPEAMLVEHGAVSEPVAGALAEGIRAKTGATFGLGITGVAGPSGGTKDKPVGLVWMGVSGPDGVTTRRLQFPGDRAQVRRLAAFAGLEMVRRRAQKSAKSPDQGTA